MTYCSLGVCQGSLQIPSHPFFLLLSLLPQLFFTLPAHQCSQRHCWLKNWTTSLDSVLNFYSSVRSTDLALLSLSLIFFIITRFSSGMFSRLCSSRDRWFSILASFSKVLRLVILSFTQVRWTADTFSPRLSSIMSCQQEAQMKGALAVYRIVSVTALTWSSVFSDTCSCTFCLSLLPLAFSWRIFWLMSVICRVSCSSSCSLYNEDKTSTIRIKG